MMPAQGIATARASAASTPTVRLPSPWERAQPLDIVRAHLSARHGGHVAIHGPIGVGKSHLLRSLATPAGGGLSDIRGAGALDLPIYVDMQAVAPFSTDRFWRRVAHLIRRMGGERFDDVARSLTDRAAIDVTAVEAFAHHIAEQGIRPVLLLDEFEWAFQSGTSGEAAASRVFLSGLAALTRRTPAEVVFVVATEPSLRDLERGLAGWRGSPLHAAFASVEIEGRVRPYADLRSTWPSTSAPSPLRDVEPGRPRVLRMPAVARVGPLDAAASAMSHSQRRSLWAAVPTPTAIGPAKVGRAAVFDGLPFGRLPAAAPGVDGRRRKPYSRPMATARAVVIDPTSGMVIVDGHAVPGLTALEYNLLALLHRNAGAVCTRAEILERLWGVDRPELVHDTRVEKLVSRLRQRLDQVPVGGRSIRTVRRQGYRYVSPEPASTGRSEAAVWD